MMKNIIQIIVSLFFIIICADAAAQNGDVCQTQIPEDLSVYTDTISVNPAVDSIYLGKDIFSVLPSKYRGDAGSVTVRQSVDIRAALYAKTANQAHKGIPGYRIRIYFSNGQKSREESLAAVERFSEIYPRCPVYRSYTSPNFKVTAGDFRTRSEALSMLNSVKYIFPSAFIVKENIKCF